MSCVPKIGNVVPLTPTCCVLMGQDGVLDYWNPVRIDDWATDNGSGRTYATRTIDHIREKQNPIALISIMRTMIAKGVYGGVEAGFIAMLAAEIIKASGLG